MVLRKRYLAILIAVLAGVTGAGIPSGHAANTGSTDYILIGRASNSASKEAEKRWHLRFSEFFKVAPSGLGEDGKPKSAGQFLRVSSLEWRSAEKRGPKVRNWMPMGERRSSSDLIALVLFNPGVFADARKNRRAADKKYCKPNGVNAHGLTRYRDLNDQEYKKLHRAWTKSKKKKYCGYALDPGSLRFSHKDGASEFEVICDSNKLCRGSTTHLGWGFDVYFAASRLSEWRQLLDGINQFLMKHTLHIDDVR